MHPSEVLFQGTQQPVSIPACDHYAGSEKLMRKSMALQQQMGPVFDITFDCEDGAAAGNEAAHAQLVANLIAGPDNHHGRIGARVHDAASPYFEQDVALICATAATRLAYLVIPKVDGVAQVRAAVAVVMRHAQAAGRNELPIHVLIETHGSLQEAWDIAALPEVECLSFGIMDFVSAHYGAIPAAAMQSPGQFAHPLIAHAKLKLAAACHAHGKIASHNVTTAIRDVSVVSNDAARAANEFAFTRMWSIHPDQIVPILAAFTPAEEEIGIAIDILAAAQALRWGPSLHHGKLHDRASYRYYWTILQKARRSGRALPQQAASLV